ncbi:MAG TPA: ABC transporter ATP-binding protein [Bdellovibrionales bacterium]|nr:ABC transporter ATP-binding protein [Bdellovibrionales bacterium]
MLEIRNIQKKFASQTALDDVSLSIAEGEFFSLLGPSGCGKSTLLRILAGLEDATSGEILWKGRRIDQLPARERPFNMVFQKYALFPHLDVFENVAFSLKLKKVPKTEIRSRVEEALALVSLETFANRLPETLSGGQQQRVALARALVNRPACVLLDEPLGALDQKLREKMQSELRLLQQRLGLTFIFVTHDQEEAMILSDRVAVMNSGRLEQVSTPRELYEAPRSLFSARFIGSRNELCANLVDRAHPAHVRMFIRPERLRILPRGGAARSGFNELEGSVQQVLFRGVRSEIVIALADGSHVRSIVELEAVGDVKLGDRVALEFSPNEAFLFSEQGI